MNATKRRLFRGVLTLATVALASSYVIAANSQPMHDHAAMAEMQPQTATVSLATIHGQQLPAIGESVRKAVQSIEAQQYDAALAQLRQAQETLAAAQTALGRHLDPAFINARCPIMGSPIKAENVTAALLREYQGRKVAFCCAGCPAAWDNLSDAEKAAKLEAAIDAPGHPMGSMM